MKVRQWLFSSLIGASLAGWFCLIEFSIVSCSYNHLFSKHDLTGPLSRSMFAGALLALAAHPFRVLYCTRTIRKTSAYMATGLWVAFLLAAFVTHFHFNLLTPVAGGIAIACYALLQFIFSRDNAFAATSLFSPFIHAISTGVLAITVLYCAIDTPNESKSEQPNILVIAIDNSLAAHLGCYEYHRATSPNIDKLASEGLTLDDCRTSANTPTVAESIDALTTSLNDTYLTGLITRQHSLIPENNFATSINCSTPSLADKLSVNIFNRKRPQGDKAQLGVAQSFIRDAAHLGQPFLLTYNLQSCASNSEVPMVARGHFSASSASPEAQLISSYDECIWYQDRLTAQLIALLDNTDIREDTIIVIIGNQLPEFIENDSRIPLIIRYPRLVAAGSRLETRLNPGYLHDKVRELLDLARQQQSASDIDAVSNGE